MYQQREQLLEKYELTVKEISKGRGTVIADTDRGKVVLKEYHGSGERVGALALVLKYLKDWDGRTEQLLADREGNYFVSDDEGRRYILKTGVFGRECDTGNAGEVLAAVKKLASFHAALMEYREPGMEIFQNPEHVFAGEVRRHNRELRCVRNYVSRKKKKNAFEELFWSCFPGYFAQAQEVAETYPAGEQNAGCCCLCHGDYNQHNVIECRSNPCIINLEQMHWDEPVGDLTKFLRKVLEKNSWQQDLGFAMIRAYEAIRPLGESERQKLRLRLSYPARFWNIANHYYNSRKAWVSQRDIEKLRGLLEVENQRKEFLKILYKSN